MLNIYELKGLNTNINISGHRGDAGRAHGNAKRGGVRVKLEAPKDLWYHPDAIDALNSLRANSMAIHIIMLQSSTNEDLEDDCNSVHTNEDVAEDLDELEVS